MTEVLIAGAGPVGLALGCFLAPTGVDVRIIDRLPEPNQLSKAVGIQSRTLELFERIGVADDVLAAGRRVHGVEIHRGDHRLASMTLDELPTRYPFVVDLPQPDTEALLAARLDALGVTVERGVDLIGADDDGDGVAVTFRREDGVEERVRANWVVGCDGSHSTVRDLAGVALEGSFHGTTFLLADTEADSEVAGDVGWEHMHVWLHGDGLLAAFPLPGTRLRLVAQVQGSAPGHDPTLEEVQAVVDERTGGGIRLRDPHWLTYLEIHHGQVPAYRSGRLVLAGDAAHLHSPIGGQGMNTGIQDAANLAWKLALVCRQGADPVLLDSYHAERHPVGAAVVSLTSRATSFATATNPAVRAVRATVLGIVSHLPPARERVAAGLSELAVEYHDSPVVAEALDGRHHLDPHRPHPGDRVADVEGLAHRDGRPARLWDAFARDRHTIVVLDGPTLGDRLGEVAAELKRLAAPLGDLVLVTREAGRVEPGADTPFDAVLLDPDDRVAPALGLHRDALVVVRPDGYLGFLGGPVEVGDLGTYRSLVGLAKE